MKKLLVAFVAVLMICAMAISMTACGSSERVKVLDVQLAGERYGYAVSQKDTTLMESVNALIEKLVGSEPYNPEAETQPAAEGVAYDLNNDGTAETVTFATLYEAENNGTAGAVDAIDYETRPAGLDLEECLVVATNAEFEPFEYMKGDKYAGIDMHIAKMLANSLGKQLVIRNLEFDVVITDVEQGTSDIGMAGLTINRGREEVVKFSDAYYLTTQRVAVLESDTTFDDCETEADFRAKVEELGKITAGAATGQTGYFYISGNTDFDYPGFDNVTCKDYDSVGLAVKNLSNGKLKFVVADKDTLMSAVEETNSLIKE